MLKAVLNIRMAAVHSTTRRRSQSSHSKCGRDETADHLRCAALRWNSPGGRGGLTIPKGKNEQTIWSPALCRRPYCLAVNIKDVSRAGAVDQSISPDRVVWRDRRCVAVLGESGHAEFTFPR